MGRKVQIEHFKPEVVKGIYDCKSTGFPYIVGVL